MPQATHTNTTSIPIADDFADIAARMKGASATAQHEDPEAELIGLCAAFHRKNAEVVALAAAIETDEDFARMDEAQVLRIGLSDEIRETPASTLAGHSAKLAVALALFDEMRDEDCADADIAFAMAALRDFTGRNSVEDPDAELIRLCDQLVQLQETISASYDESLTDTEIEAAVAPHTAEHFAIRDRVVAIGLPKTQAGALAFAKAAYAMGQRWADGAIITNCFSDWMAFAAVQALSGGGGEPAPRPDWHP